MFDALDIALLMDNRSLDADGNAFTPCETRYGRDGLGIRAILGDGTTAATMPTLDALQGRFTFDGGDYIVLPAATDVASVLANMGSAQDEFWLFLMKNSIWTAATNQVLFYKDGAAGEMIRLRYGVANTITLDTDNGAGGTESLAISAAATALTQNAEIMIGFQRANNVQEIWFWDILVDSDTDATVDASSAGDAYIGANDTPAQFIRNNCGISFFGYGRGRITAAWMQAIRHRLRGNL